MPVPQALIQFDYRWFGNLDDITPLAKVDQQHVPIRPTEHGIPFRLRMNIGADGLNIDPGDLTLRLQYATSTDGPFTDVGPVGSAETWRFFDNPSVASEAVLPILLLTTSSVLQTYQETNPAIANPNLIGVSQRAEWDWSLEDNFAPDDTTFFFRVVKADGTLLDTYTFFPELTTAPAPLLNQRDYRWFSNVDAITPTTPFAGENIRIEDVDTLTLLRIRMNVQATVSNLLPTIQDFNLEYATATAGPWTSVGAVGSAESWRFFDNPSVTDGSTLPSSLLSTSTLRETYQESNPTPVNQTNIREDDRAEWDWAIQNNFADPDTIYLFRMVEADGTPLESYSNFPTLKTTPAPILTQQDYRWFDNIDDITPTSPLALENNDIIDVGPVSLLRLRINVGVLESNLVDNVLELELQYATSTSGPWTNVGAIGSTDTWRFFDNPSVADGATLPSVLLASSTVPETYQESNPSPLNPNPINIVDTGEWDWAFQNNFAPPNTTFFFRLANAVGTPLNNYVNFPQLTTFSIPVLAQQDYRWIDNIDNIEPILGLAVQNAPITDVGSTTALHLRMNVAVTDGDLIADGLDFRLQYATSISGFWTDVGAAGSSETWRFFDNPSVADGAILPAVLLTTSDVRETYQESNPSLLNPNRIIDDEKGEWAWIVQNNLAPIDTTFFFRMVRGDGTTLDNYVNFPELTTAVAPVLTQQDYRWFENVDAITPFIALGGENVARTNSTPITVHRLRMNISGGGATLAATEQAFKLQYATDTSGPWTDVGAIGSTDTWRFFNNPSVADGATLPSVLLSSSNVTETYQESNPSALNPNAITPGDVAEWDWVVQNNIVPSGTFFFRMVKDDGTPLDNYVNFPTIVTLGPLVTQQDYRWRENRNSLEPGSPLAPENTPITVVSPDQVYRLRVNLEVEVTELPEEALAFKLQYATDTTGPWTDVGAIGSSETWTGFDNTGQKDEKDKFGGIERIVLEYTGLGPVDIEVFLKGDLLVTLANVNTSDLIEISATPETDGNLSPELRVVIDSGPVTAIHTSGSIPLDIGDVHGVFIVDDLDKLPDEDGDDDVEDPQDGALIEGDLLTTTTDIRESYEEENPSVLNPNAIGVLQRGEWDWVILDNGSASFTTYFFRMVRANDTPLDSYARFPTINTPPPRTLTQEDYRWRENRDRRNPGQPLAEENQALVPVLPGQAYRLRVNVEVGNLNLLEDSKAFKLQYSTDTSGPWTDVGAVGSSSTWTGFDNPKAEDGKNAIGARLSTTDERESYEEENPSVLNPKAIDIGERDEWDWVIFDNDALPDTNYFFRMVEADGSLLTSYTRFPTIAMPSPVVLTQQDYRWRENVSILSPGKGLADENEPFIATTPDQAYRLRMNVETGIIGLLENTKAFKLQYSTSTSGPWTDVGAIGSGETWTGFDNANAADGADVIGARLKTTDVLESYEEENPSVLNPESIQLGERGEWDWVVLESAAPPNTTFFFRMVETDGAPLGSYVRYPEITTTAPQSLTQQDYRWHENNNDRDPGQALVPENTPFTTVFSDQAYRLRVNVEVAGTDLNQRAQTFRLQYSTNTSGPWTDVGAIGSSETWTGFDNSNARDGSEIRAAQLSTTNVRESYEEENPSALNRKAIDVGDRGEWDWVVFDNDTQSDTAYFFRMVKAGGAPLDSYVRFPQINTPPPLILTQEDYRWHGNDDDLEPGQAIAPENSAIAIFSLGLVLRLRMNIEVEGVDLSQGVQAFKLQFATSTSGPWTDVGAIGSSETWTGFDNLSAADGSEITGSLLSTTDLRESYEEANPSALNPGTIEVGARGEWDWVVFDNDTELDTIYFFRMVKADGTPLDSYTRFPQITVPAALDITQQDYRWYGNLANVDPVIAQAPENTALAGATPLSVFRIRMSLTIDGRAMPAGSQAFKLQYATSTSGPWTDVGAIGSGETWRGFNNGSVADGADITALRLAASDVLETYEERNPSAPNTNTVNPGQQAEWDWVVQNNVASPGTYFFRMVTNDGSPLDEYTNYPEVTAVMPPLTQQDYRWYQNENDVNPNSPLAGENTGFATAAPGAIYRIRMNVEVTGVALPLGALAFKLQYSTNTSGPWTDVGDINSSSLWRGFNNSSPTDGDPISLRLVSSDVGESYEEANPSRVNRNAIAVGSRGEWDWVVQNNNALGDTTYFFRMVQADSTPLNAYTNFPTLSTILPPIASDDFESGGASGGSGWLGPWNFDGDAKIEKRDEPHQGSFHLRLKRTNGHADRSLDLFGKNSVRVQFWAKAEQFKSGDTATLSASTDGITYQTVETWTISDSDGQYRFFDIELPASSFSSTSFIAFDSNMSDKKAKFFIDELIVIGD